MNALITPITPIRFDIRCALGYQVNGPSDFIFNIEVSDTQQQRPITSHYTVTNAANVVGYQSKDLPNRFIRFSATSGVVNLDYQASVMVTHFLANPNDLHEHSIADLPKDVLPYLLPSRYCESDKLFHFANANFGQMPRGYKRIQAICDWVYQCVRFSPGASIATTSAVDTLASGAGVCRDFAHLTIALLRALNIPARFVAGYDYGADIALGPTDFHAYVEAYVGNRWFIFDATRICPRNGLVRIGTGFDAADVAFATIFGPTQFTGMKLDIQPFDQTGAPIVLIDNLALAISTWSTSSVNNAAALRIDANNPVPAVNAEYPLPTQLYVKTAQRNTSTHYIQ